MSIKRGDVAMAWFPFASGTGGKRRPCLIVQNDVDNQKLANTVIARITSNLRRAGDKSHVLIELATPEGQQAGLLHDSLVSCNNLATIEQNLIAKVIGSLPAGLMQRVNDCLKAALELPSRMVFQGRGYFNGVAFWRMGYHDCFVSLGIPCG
jgi:mRNA interferase MazF